MPKVSIVLPSYNGEKYIRESVESIINQSFTDWELVLVDDCSTDHTAAIADQYAEQDFRIKVIHNKKNQKLPQSLNIGFQICQGEFLTWTSDDNYYKKDALKEMLEYLHENDRVAMVCADMVVINDMGEKLYELKMFDKLDIFYNNCVGACFLYKRKVFDELGGYDVDMFLVEDYAYWLKIIKHYGMIGHIENILYGYRMHENSLTAQRQMQIKTQLLRLRKKNMDLILEHLRDHKKIISFIFYEFLEMNEEVCSIEEKIFNIVPELGMDRITEDDERKFIIWGAGNYGEKAFDYLNGKAAYFVDIDSDKIGKYKCGLKIISKECLLELHNNYNILVAVSYEKLYDILHFLYRHGIKSCSSYQKQIWYNSLKHTK